MSCCLLHNCKFTAIIYNTHVCFIICHKYVYTYSSHSLACLPCGISLSFGCVAWNSRHIKQFSMAFSISIINIDQVYGFTCQKSSFFYIMQLVCSWSGIYCCKEADTVIPLLFITVPSVTAMSSQMANMVEFLFWLQFLLIAIHLSHMKSVHLVDHLPEWHA